MACWDVCACEEGCDCQTCACPCLCKQQKQCACCVAMNDGEPCPLASGCTCNDDDFDDDCEAACHDDECNHDNDSRCDPREDDGYDWMEECATHWYGVSQGKGVIKAVPVKPVDGSEVPYDPGFADFARDAMKKAGIE